MFSVLILLPFIFSLIIGFLGRFFGNKGSTFLSCVGMFINFILTIFFLYFSIKLNFFFYFSHSLWFTFYSLEVFWNFSFDSLAIVMFFVVNTVSFVVHVFSSEYMSTDPHLPRFMSYISLFTFFMLILITADNLLQLFLGWEGVGLCSYLLIGFWYTRVNAISSALKALIVNRISDFAILAGIFLVFWLVSSIDFSIMLPLINFFILTNFNIFNNFIIFNVLTTVSFFFLLGAMGKSAQILLHTWLPDAMEGPTPVSALIHAATMVTAGIFLIIKCSILFEFSGMFLTSLILIGGLTSFMSGTIGMVQFDIKKVIAYSTCSQLGYMLLACGLSNYAVSFFHLMNHAFFKALLFLCAGCVIHSMDNEQDMRQMGGSSTFMPVVSTFMLIGTLALCGFTFLTGFFSKDFILEQILYFFFMYDISLTWSFSVCFLFITTWLTGFYSSRLCFISFFEIPMFPKNLLNLMHESPMKMLVPLIILLLGSIFLGFIFRDLFLGVGSDFFKEQIFTFPTFNFFFESELISSFFKIFIFIFFIFFSILSYVFCFNFLTLKKFKDAKFFFFNLFFFFNSKWGFDIIYNKFINIPGFLLFYIHVYELFDKLLLEKILGFFKILKISSVTFAFLRTFFQNGNIFFYLFTFLFFFIFFIFL